MFLLSSAVFLKNCEYPQNIFCIQKKNLTMHFYLESRFVGNPEDRFCHIDAHVMYIDSSSSGGVSCSDYLIVSYISHGFVDDPCGCESQ